jgi:hypothetical protein
MTPFSARDHLQSLGIEHASLTGSDVVTMSYTLHGWHVVPRTPAGAPPIVARVWLLAALNTRGRYAAPERDAHPADLEDGESFVDSVILMAVIQRHFLIAAEPGWNDVTLARQLGLSPHDVRRAQFVLDAAEQLLRHRPRPAPLGPHWWRYAENGRSV